MKKLSFLICLVISLISFFSAYGQTFQINGHIEDLKPGIIYLQYYSNIGKMVTDSTYIKNGRFKFSGYVSYPTAARLTSKDRSFSKIFYLENTLIKVRGASVSKELTITGSKTERENEELQTAVSKIAKKQRLIKLKYKKDVKNKNKKKAKLARKKLLKVTKDIRITIKKFINEHPDSFISLYNLRKLARGMNYYSLHKMFSNLSYEVKNSVIGRKFAKELKGKSKTAVGKKAPNFSQKDVGGNPVTLLDYRGKYVLVDFWASWCGPCRAENPKYVAAYNKYKNDGFTILGVSLDTKRSNWLKAIKDDSLKWTQVSDLKGFKNKVARLYGIKFIPANFLIDPDGVIIAEDLRGESLSNKLNKIFSRDIK